MNRGSTLQGRKPQEAKVSHRLSYRWIVLLTVLLFVVTALPILAITTPPGQRLIENSIEAPILARLVTAVPPPFALTVDDLETRVGPTSIDVVLAGTNLSGPGLSVHLESITVSVDLWSVARGNVVPRSIAITDAVLALESGDTVSGSESNLQEAVGDAFRSAFGAFDDLALSTPQEPVSIGFEDLSSDAEPPPDDARSKHFETVVSAADRLDHVLAELTTDETWLGLDAVTVDQLTVRPDPQSPFPVLREASQFEFELHRINAQTVEVHLEAVNRPDPFRIDVRHAEGDVPEGPGLMAEHFGLGLREGQAFSHFLVQGLSVDHLTDALREGSAVAFSSTLAAELVITRDPTGQQIDQIIALFESDAGYLVASGKHAAIVEFISIPIIYTRETERFDIVQAQLRFPNTGGVFAGSIASTVRDGETGVAVSLVSDRYLFSAAANERLGREESRRLGEVRLDLFAPDTGGRVDLELAQISLGDVIAASVGRFEQTERGPFISLVGQTSPMTVTDFAKIWPLPASPSGRSWFLKNIAEGDLGPGELSFAAHLNEIEIRNGRTVLGSEMLSVSVDYENLVMRSPGDLPFVFGLDGSLRVTGRSLRMEGRDGVGRLPEGDQIQVRTANFFIPDHAQRNPFAALELEMEGPTSGFVRLAGLDPINLADQIPFEASALDGRTDLYGRVEAFLADEIDRETLRASMDARVTGFASSEPVEGRRLTDGTFILRSRDADVMVAGEALLDGVPTQLNISTADARGLQVSMRLDEQDRAQMGLDLRPYLTGAVGVAIEAIEDDGSRAMTIDLTDATVTVPELGFAKASGASAQARFRIVENNGRQQVRDLLVTAPGLRAQGSMDLVDGTLRIAEFEQVAMDGVGSFSIDLTRNDTGLAARISGDRFVLMSDLLRSDRDAAGALAIDIELGELVTEGGARIQNVALSYSQTASRITRFELRARHDDGTDLAGTLSPTDERLVISSGNAGTFLRFLGLYERAQGGRATLVLDPGSVGGRLAGQLLLNDFQIANEPAMETVFNSAVSRDAEDSSRVILPGSVETPDLIEITATNVSFDRTPERLIIQSAEGWGPSLGGNLDGVIDYENDQMRLSGTYVPFFSINNVFSRIPIIGQALGGREREGLLGVTFEVAGPIDQPQLRVNPMSLLAPGFLRNLFEFQNGG
ncbi:MAG: hypothetical protein AAF590_11520 [Pseudomonadota bacterium]